MSVSISNHLGGRNAASIRPHGHRRNLSTEVSESARLDVVIPHASQLDISDAIAANHSGAKPSTSSNIPAVAHIEQRSHLFYDEKLPVFVILEILAELDDNLFEHYLARLAVSLEVTAVDGQRQQQGLTPRSHEVIHLLFQTVVDEKKNPRIPVQATNKRLAVWKLDVPLGHPKARLNNPRVVLTCSATLRPAELQKPLFEDEYITSRQPMGMNLLESFSEIPSLASSAPRLSALRVSRVIPVTQAHQQALRPLGYAAKRAFNIYPAINIRLRYSRIPSAGRQIVMASLDLEVTPFSECSVAITKVDIAVVGGKAELLTDSPPTALPVTCRPQDDVTFLYNLSQIDTGNNHAGNPLPPTSQVRAISVSLEATALVSDDCHPQIFTHWATTVDFAPPTIQHFPAHTGIQRAHRPPSLGSIIHGATVSSSTGIRPDQPAVSPAVVFTPPIGSHEHSPMPLLSADSPPLGLTVTFTGPSRVYVGEVFTWSVFVVNRSSRTRKLALVVPPKRKKIGEGKTLPATPAAAPPEPVMEEAMVWQTHKLQYLEPAELVPLVNDIRIGPLMPSACHTTELRDLPCIVCVGRR
ncbi:TRAPP trafficking subunit Trs65-domain-containing protein [Geopyxis carbonaria]|nr:TRAPP trafficking subunit Trs65-domain-containing protein [Geopyxis carbonaria]